MSCLFVVIVGDSVFVVTCYFLVVRKFVVACVLVCLCACVLVCLVWFVCLFVWLVVVVVCCHCPSINGASTRVPLRCSSQT